MSAARQTCVRPEYLSTAVLHENARTFRSQAGSFGKGRESPGSAGGASQRSDGSGRGSG